MNTFFLDNFINTKELTHLTKEVRRKQLNKTIGAIKRLNEMQNDIIKQQQLSASEYLQKQLSKKNAKEYF